MSVNNNAQYLKKRFPRETISKLRELLEELDNDIEMAMEILQEEEGVEPAAEGISDLIYLAK